jgi:hypothetical protein
MVALEKHIEPRKLYYARQIKHFLDLDKYPWWKQFIFYRIYRPFVMFVEHTLKMPVLMKLDADGKPCWEERQGVFTAEEDAQRTIAGQRWWSYVELFENVALPPETCVVGTQVEVGRDANEVHVRENWPTRAVTRKKLEAVENVSALHGVLNKPITGEAIEHALRAHERIRRTLSETA